MFNSTVIQVMINSFWPMCLAALQYTIPLAIVSFFFGTILAFLVAVMRLSTLKPLQGIAQFYVWLIRGTPLMVQLFVIFYGLPSLNIVLPPFISGVIGLSLCQGAYSSEIVRAAILSIKKGQWEAAKALGLTKWQTYRYIIIPQAARTAVPALGNQFIGLTKDTSLCGMLTIPELLQKTKMINAQTSRPLELYLECALVYLIMNTVLTIAQSRIEKRFSRHIATKEK